MSLMLLFFRASPVDAAERGTPGTSMTLAPAIKPDVPPYDPVGLRVEYGVVLPKEMKLALKSFDPDFRVWEQSDYAPKDVQRYPFSLQSTPSAVIGDFNGDGKLDAVLAGRNTHGPEVLAVLSTERGYRVLPVHRGDLFDRMRRWNASVSTFQTGDISR